MIRAILAVLVASIAVVAGIPTALATSQDVDAALQQLSSRVEKLEADLKAVKDEAANPEEDVDEEDVGEELTDDEKKMKIIKKRAAIEYKKRAAICDKKCLTKNCVKRCLSKPRVEELEADEAADPEEDVDEEDVGEEEDVDEARKPIRKLTDDEKMKVIKKRVAICAKKCLTKICRKRCHFGVSKPYM